MRRTITLAFLLILIPTAHASPPPIKVLVAKCGNTISGYALEMLDRINDLTDASGLGDHNFINAGSGVPNHGSNYVYSTSCFGADIFAAAEDSTLKAKRDQLNADIVLILTPSLPLSVRGITHPKMINSFTFAGGLQEFAYSMVSQEWFAFVDKVVASHETLHILGAEHKIERDQNGDPSDDNHEIPLGGRANHAATELERKTGTAVASTMDCEPYFECNRFINRMSRPGDTFDNGRASGNQLHSNVHDWVKAKSWHVVAAFREPAQAATPNLEIEQLACETASWTAFALGPEGSLWKWQRKLDGGAWGNLSGTYINMRSISTVINSTARYRVAVVIDGLQSAWSNEEPLPNDLCYIEPDPGWPPEPGHIP